MSRHSVHIAVFAIIRHGERILMLRRQNTQHENGYLTLPAGHLEESENMYAAVSREAHEEVGIEVESCTLVHTMHVLCPNQTADYVYLFFNIDTYEGTPKNMEPEKCSELLWAHPSEREDHVSGYITQALLSIKEGMSGSTYIYH